MTAARDLLDRLERYYDAVPRSEAHVEDFGTLTLFVRDRPGHPYYARPTLGRPGPVPGEDVRAVLRRQQELGVPRSIEWVHETTPSLAAAAAADGMTVRPHPLMVHTGARPTDQSVGSSDAHVLGADDPLLTSALAAADLAFAEPGTARGTAGRPELDERAVQVSTDGSVPRMADRIRSGHGVIAAVTVDGLAVCSGQHNPVGTTTEIVGVATTPAYRRRGLAAAVTRALVDDAYAHGVTTVFLSADDDAVARVYARLGFEPVGTAMIAEA